MVNTCHTCGNGNIGETATARERVASNSRHAIGDNSREASQNQEITISRYNSIATTTRVIYRVPFIYGDGSEVAAILEGRGHNTGHTCGDVDRGEAAAIPESIRLNTCYTLGDGDGGEAAATIESTVSNARHGLGDGDGGEAAA